MEPSYTLYFCQMEKLHLSTPLSFRRNIPFYHQKTEQEFKQDKYENYAETVMRQTRLHLSKQAHEAYAFQPILDWVFQEIDQKNSENIAEIGCSVGRLIGELAMRFPTANCWGMDYSYQLLRQAKDYWIDGKILDLQDTNKGFKTEKLQGKGLNNLQFALAKGECLPFENDALNLVVSSFTLDRFDEPNVALLEMFRILKNDGKVLIISPLNFQKATHWAQLFPIVKLLREIQKIGFKIEKVTENIIIKESLDARGNSIHWECVGLNLVKKG